MGSRLKDEHQGPSSLSPRPTIPTSHATLEVLDALYEKQLPMAPYAILPDLEQEITIACPPSIRKLWDIPEHDLTRSYSCQNLPMPSTSAQQNDNAQVNMLLEPHSQPNLKAEGMETNCNRPFALLQEPESSSPSPEASTSRTTPRHQARDTPPTPSPPPMHTSPIPIQHGDRAERRQAIGRALVSVRDRVPIEDWLAGIQLMERHRLDTVVFYGLLSEGMRSNGRARDV